MTAANANDPIAAGLLGRSETFALDDDVLAEISGRYRRVNFQVALGVTGLNSFVSPEAYGAVGDGATDDTSALNDCFVDAAASGKVVQLGAKTYRFNSQLTVPDNLTVYGVPGKSWLEKNFITTGTSAGIQPAVIGPNLDRDASETDGADNVTFVDVGFKASAHTIGGTKTNKLLWCNGNNWRLIHPRFDTWSGWACTIGAFRVLVYRPYLTNPFAVAETGENGVDGIHIVYGGHITVVEPDGQTTDDLVAVIPAISGDMADLDISDVRIVNPLGHSTDARCVAIGSWNAVLTGTVENVVVDGYNGRSGTSSNGAISIFSQSTAGGTTRNITVKGANVDNTGAQSGIIVRSDVKAAENVSLEFNIFGTGERGFNTIGPFKNLRAVGTVDSSAFSGGTATNRNAVVVTVPDGARNPMFDLSIIGNADANAMQVAAGAASPMSGGYIRADIVDLGSNRTGFNTAALTDCDVTVTVKKASGATGTAGIAEGANATRNNWSGSDVSDCDTPIQNASDGSNWTGVGGVLQRGQGPDLTISGGAITVTHEFHRVDTEGAAATDDLDTINLAANAPDGLRIRLRTVNGGRDVTLKDATDNLLLGADIALTKVQSVVELQTITSGGAKLMAISARTN